MPSSPLTTHPAAARRDPLRRARRALAALLLGGGLAVGLAGPADAATSSSVGVAAATSYGFECDATYHWVHENWPDISVRSATPQEVRVRALLYRWNGQGWDAVQTSEWYVGRSDVTGRLALGHSFGNLPYYFALAGQPSLATNPDGYGFDHLASGWYATVEEYQAGGRTWSANTRVEGTPDVTSCQA